MDDEHGSALELARGACEATGFRNARYLDTLALALFRQGEVADAVRYQTLALDLLPARSTDREQMEQRLSEYQHAQGVGPAPDAAP